MSKVTADMLVVGFEFWYHTYTIRYGPVPQLLRVTGEKEELEFSQTVTTKIICGPYAGTNKTLYLGDAGVRPCNYDNRPTQTFTTEVEMLNAIDSWKGRNPNFLVEEE